MLRCRSTQYAKVINGRSPGKKRASHTMISHKEKEQTWIPGMERRQGKEKFPFCFLSLIYYTRRKRRSGLTFSLSFLVCSLFFLVRFFSPGICPYLFQSIHFQKGGKGKQNENPGSYKNRTKRTKVRNVPRPPAEQ